MTLFIDMQKLIANAWEIAIKKKMEDFIKKYNEENDEEYFLEMIFNDQNKMEIEKIEKLVANLHDKTKYVIHIRNLKQALNNGLVF